MVRIAASVPDTRENSDGELEKVLRLTLTLEERRANRKNSRKEKEASKERRV